MQHNQGNKMTKGKTSDVTPDVYDRIYLDVPGKTIVIELLDGFDGLTGDETYMDCWRLIDLETGEVFAQETNLHGIVGEASAMTCKASPDKAIQERQFEYITGRPPLSTYRIFKELPLVQRIRYITELAQDLEHDLIGAIDDSNRDPIEVATEELNDMYNEKPCFYIDRQTGQWELDVDLY
jgi:hypothetical protein